MKRMYKSNEQTKFLEDIEKSENKEDMFFIRTGELCGCNFLMMLMKHKPKTFSVSIGYDFIIAEPAKEDDGRVGIIDDVVSGYIFS